MTISRTFDMSFDRDDAFFGFKPSWVPSSDPTGGRGVAHDILEHFTSKEKAVESEMLAVGSFIAMRLDTGPATNAAQSIALSIEESLCFAVKANRYLTFNPTRPLDHNWVETKIAEALPIAKTYIIDRLKESNTSFDVAFIDILLEQSVHLIRSGFRRCKKRFEGYDLYTIGNYVFPKIEKLADSILMEEILGVESQVRFLVNISTLDVSAKIRHAKGSYFFDF